jgi:hypothetical protein
MASLTPLSGTLGDINAAHLLRRATFNPNQNLINQFTNYTIQQAMTALFEPLSLNVQEPLHIDTNQPYIPSYQNPDANNYFDDLGLVVSWYFREARMSNTIHFKSAIWLHTMFIINYGSVGGHTHFFDYLQLLNYYSDKSIKEFAKKISRSNAMSLYLSNYLNSKTAPNENYAREFLELFTIMKGPQDAPGSYTNYTEQDVQAAAKVLTGFISIHRIYRLNYLDPVIHIPLGTTNFSDHDTSNKTFSGKFNNQVITGATASADMNAELDAFIDMVFDQTTTALNYARRMYRYFVKTEITSEVETGIITPLANNLMATNYNINSTLQLLLSSQHFFDAEDGVQYDQIIGGKIKSPMELFLKLLSQLEITTADPSTNTVHNFWFYRYVEGMMANCSMQTFGPPFVAGYPAVYEFPYDNLWINTAVLRTRYNVLIDMLISGFNSNGFTTKLDTVLFVKNSGHFSDPANATALIDEMLNLLLAVMPTGSRYTYFTQSLLGGLSTTSWQFEWNNYIASNNNTAVKIALDRLVNAIVKSAEYQVF